MLDGLEVGEGPAKPALVDVVLGGVVGGLAHGVAGLALGAHEDDPTTVLDQVHQDGVGFVDRTHGVLEIDDVDAVAGAEDEAPHAGVPALSLVSEMDPGGEQFANIDEGQVVTQFLYTSAAVIPIGEDRLLPAGPAGQVACLVGRPETARGEMIA